MKIRSRISLLALAFVAFFSVSGVGNAYAQSVSSTSLSESQLQQIRSNCQTIQATLNQLHASDALLRVNRGQLYETLSTKLMNNFNGRVVSNGRDAQGLLTISNSYQTALAAFRTDYQSYERQMTAVSRTDCADQPAAFYDAVNDAREKRSVVNKRVGQLHDAINDYRSAIGVIRSELPEEVSR